MSKFQIKVSLLVLLLLANLFLLAWKSAENPFDKTITTARTEIWKAITSGTAGSATVAIMDDGKLIYVEGFGMADRETSIAVDENTVFNIGSISKLFAATSIMLLVDEGKVDLDKPVTTYLPEFAMSDERYKDITVRMLLNHSSGLPGFTFWNNFGSEYNQNIYAELLASLSRSTLKHRPGELATYCNDGFTLAEMIVAKVTGKSYGDFLAERVFEPLDMNHTSFGVGRLPQGMIPAKYYRPDGKSEPLEIVSLLASGGLSSTAADLCRFAAVFTEDSAVLSTQSRMEMLKLQPSELQGKLRGDTFPFGLGWDYADLSAYSEKSLRLYGKSGGTGHYAAMLYTLPSEGISVAVIASGVQCDSSGIAFKVLKAYLEEKGLITEEEKAVKAPVKAQPIPSELMVYEGYYCAGGDPVRIALDDEIGQLTSYSVDGGNESALFSAVYNDGFFYDGEQKYYFTTVDGTHYFVESFPNYDKVTAEKLQSLANPQQLSIPMDGKVWLRRNVEATEETMFLPTHIVSSSQIADLPGYVNFNGMKTVKSTDYAGMPVKSMRDLTELTLVERNGATWAWLSGADYMPAELAVPLNVGANTRTIGSEGYNEWLIASFDTILCFEVPAKGRAIVFGPEGVLYDSIVDSGEVFVPAGSLIEVAGNPGDLFKVTANAVD